MKLETLKNILNHHFQPPFVPKGTVVAEWYDDEKRILSISIGPRDIQIDENGNVIGAGTFLE